MEQLQYLKELSKSALPYFIEKVNQMQSKDYDNDKLDQESFFDFYPALKMFVEKIEIQFDLKDCTNPRDLLEDDLNRKYWLQLIEFSQECP